MSGIPKRGRPNGVALILSDFVWFAKTPNRTKSARNWTKSALCFPGSAKPQRKSDKIGANRTFSACPHSAVPFWGTTIMVKSKPSLRGAERALFSKGGGSLYTLEPTRAKETTRTTRFATPPTLYRAPKQEIRKMPFLRPKNGLWGGPTWTHFNSLLGIFNSPLP